MKLWRIGRFLAVILIGITIFGACSQGDSPDAPKVFDPQNEAHLIDIYVRTNYYRDFAVFEKYGLDSKKAATYTEAIVQMSQDIKDWQRFSQKSQTYREKIKGEYPEQAVASEETSALGGK